MKLKKIKFSQNYEKLSKIDSKQPVVLLEVFIKMHEHLGKAFVEYDTQYETDGNYELVGDRFLVLLFEQNGNLFTTLRSFDADKAGYYFGMRGKKLEVIYTHNE